MPSAHYSHFLSFVTLFLSLWAACEVAPSVRISKRLEVSREAQCVRKREGDVVEIED